MAARRNNRRRRRNRGRFGPLFKLLCAAALVVALTVGGTVFFRVERVSVSGNSRYTQEEIISAAGIRLGDNLFRLNKNQISRQIRQKLPYVEALSIWRQLPNAIVLELNECQAAAQVVVPDPARVAQLQAERLKKDPDAKPLQTAQEPWLISAGGKLLEPAPAGSTALTLSGVTPLAPKAGEAMRLPEEEQARLDALKSLLDALEQLGQLDRVSSIELTSTRIWMRYLDRFDVKLPINGDFLYQLQVLDKGVEETRAKHGKGASGTMDLTQKDYALVYSGS